MAELNMDDGWEAFTGYRHNRQSGNERDIPTVTLLARGDISLNEKALELLNTSQVTLAYHREKRIIRISGTAKKGRKIRKGAGRSSVVAAKDFTTHFDLRMSHAQHYVAEVQDGMLYIYLGTR